MGDTPTRPGLTSPALLGYPGLADPARPGHSAAKPGNARPLRSLRPRKYSHRGQFRPGGQPHYAALDSSFAFGHPRRHPRETPGIRPPVDCHCRLPGGQTGRAGPTGPVYSADSPPDSHLDLPALVLQRPAVANGQPAGRAPGFTQLAAARPLPAERGIPGRARR